MSGKSPPLPPNLMPALPRVALDRGFVSAPIAHRALHDRAAGRLENSPAAISAAIDAGFGIEIDVQLSCDGHAMVFHDYTLARLTDAKGPLRAQTADYLRQIRLSGMQETIPTLADVLTLVRGRVPLLIEIKDQSGDLGPAPSSLESAVATDLAGYSGAVAVMSFNPHVVAAFGALCPQIARGIVTCPYPTAEWPHILPARCEELRQIADYDRLGASFISHQANDLGNARVGAMKARGAVINCWTIKSAAKETQARQIADTITFEGYLPTPPANTPRGHDV